jgi:peptide/nickel transport system ATP-binding protein
MRLVMCLGRIVKSASHAILWRDPRRPYTRAMFAAVPSADPTHARTPPSIQGERRGCCLGLSFLFTLP